METITAFFGASLAGAVFVPINPVLRPPQVHHILTDCTVPVLIPSRARLRSLDPFIESCPGLRYVVLTDATDDDDWSDSPPVTPWAALPRAGAPGGCRPPRRSDFPIGASTS